MTLLVLIGLAFIFFLVLGIWSLIGLSNVGKEKTNYYDGPEMTADQKQNHMEWVEEHIREFPNGTYAHNYPKIQSKILNDRKAGELAQIYRDADRQYRLGLISKEQYEEVIDAISKELDISHLDIQQ